jgi:peptide/nickel transport system substrate-binding protein/oligopeptide transport system substrate-binding protein
VHVALSQALDRGALNAAAYGGGALAADGFFPPTVGGVYRPGACGASTPSTADPAAATATLGRAAISLSGRPLKLYYNDQFGNRPLAEAIAREWEQNLGLHVLLTPEPWDQYLAQANSATGFDGAFLEAWQSPYPSADAYLYPMFDSASVGTDNFAHYIDPTFDREMTNVARAATSTASRTLAYQHLAAGLCQRLPLVPLLFRQWHYGVRTTQVGSAIGSFTDAATGLLDLREVYVRP